MGSYVKYCLALVSITLFGGSYLQNIRDEYCELYLNESKINENSCYNNGSYVVTIEYGLILIDPSNLVLNWTKDNLIEWNIGAITNKMLNLSVLRVLGIRSLEDHRLRTSSFYLNKLNVEYAFNFEIDAQDFWIHEMNSHYKMGPTSLRIYFKRSEPLGPINDYVAGSAKRIEQLYILGLHHLGSDLCRNVQFFRFPGLQENLVELYLQVEMTVNMKCFENYRKLTHISLAGLYEPFENLTALICNFDFDKKCKFTIGRKGLRCPTNYVCTYHRIFQIYCHDRENRPIPPLPIPSDYRIHLTYSGMQLIQLPNNTLPGYMEVYILDVSYNNISSLAVHQLPRNLSILDISHNPITTIDNGVINYLNEYATNVYQTSKWIANCDERALLKMLHWISYFGKVFFEKLNGYCPNKCQCCFDKNTETFLIDCRSETIDFKAWDNSPIPDPLPKKVILLLSNCSIRNLPKKMTRFVKTYNITHVDLRKNFLKSLDEEIVDFFNKHDNTTTDLSENPWSCICKPRSFLFFLKTRSPEEYSSALARCKIPICPDSCVCCLDNLNSSALNVDCRGQRLTQFPLQPDSVTSLDNYVTEINKQSQTFLNNKIFNRRLTVFLSENPWNCTCELLSNAKYISFDIQDFTAMQCSNLGKRLALVEESEVCPSYFIYPLLLFVFIMTIITALNAIVYFKQPILMWFYEHEVCMSMAVREDLERLKKFDAFLCFTHKDEHLIEDYVERLENGQRKFRLCFYLRDWNIGASIPECIIQSVKDSRRIIILMTKNFLESTWGKLEFRLALHATSKDRCKRLIVILYPDVENFDDLDSELKAYMVLNTYLRRDNPNFWNKLLYSMPHIS